MEVDTGFEPVWTALQAAASPLGQSTVRGFPHLLSAARQDHTRADDEIRTRDPNLGKVMRYHCATSACILSNALMTLVALLSIRKTTRLLREILGCQLNKSIRNFFHSGPRAKL